MEEIRKRTRCVYPVINKWVNLVHHSKEFSDIYDAMDKLMYERFHDDERPKSEDTETTYANSFLRRVVLDNIFPGEDHLKNFFFERFPGSVPTFLTKRSVKNVSGDYYVTPHGRDSVRCMMLSLFVSRFPRWVLKIRNRATGVSYFQKLNMCDNCAINTTVVYLTDNNQESMEIVFPSTDESYLLENLEGRYYLTSLDSNINHDDDDDSNEKNRRNEERHKRLMMDDEDEDDDEDEEEEDVITTSKRRKGNKKNKKKFTRVEVIKKYGKVVNYFCDRKFNFYYVEDEYVFPVIEEKQQKIKYDDDEEEENHNNDILPKKRNIIVKKRVHSYQAVVLLDGEICMNLTTNHYDFRIFDVISFCNRRGKVCSCLSLKLEEKLKIMKHNIVDAYQDFLALDHQSSPNTGMGVERELETNKRIRLKVKDFYHGREIQSLMDRIQTISSIYTRRRNETETTTINNRYENDGIIIVPNDLIQFRFKSNRTLNLFRWSRPENYFVNILIFPLQILSPSKISTKFIYSDLTPPFNQQAIPLQTGHPSSTSVLPPPPPSQQVLTYFERQDVDSVTMDVGTYLSEAERSDLWNRRKDGAVVQCTFRNGRIWVIRKVLKYFKKQEQQEHNDDDDDDFKKSVSNFQRVMYMLQSHIENIGVTQLFKILSGIKYYETFPTENYRKELKLQKDCIWSHIRTVILESTQQQQDHRSTSITINEPPKVYEKLQLEMSHTNIEQGEEQQQQKQEEIWKRLKYVTDCVGPNYSYGRKLRNHVKEYLASLMKQQQQQVKHGFLEINQKICVRVIYLPTGYFQILDFQNIFVGKEDGIEQEEEDKLRKVCSFSRCLKSMESQIRWIVDYKNGLKKRKRNDDDDDMEEEKEEKKEEEVFSSNKRRKIE